jgi:CPA2 family monovalent cation:H+ antiporter-2
MVCRRLNVPLLVGFLVIGAVIGRGGLSLVSQENHELEYLARAGALLLLFSVGIEFSPGELVRLGRSFLISGPVQMLATAVPLLLLGLAFSMPWRAAVLVSSAAALSSTVIVFKTLVESGQLAYPHGRRGLSILLFQDVALVPLMLMVPLLTGVGERPSFWVYLALAAKSLMFVLAVLACRWCIGRFFVPLLARLRSVELVVLFALALLGGACWISFQLGLSAALGAFAAGLMLSGNRLSTQVDTIIVPFRESFAAVFFVTLGTLLEPLAFLREPLLLTGGLVGVLVLKTGAATLALRLTGLSWKGSFGMGLGLAQLGEFSFLLLAEGAAQGLVSESLYSRTLFVALGSLMLTPLLLNVGLRFSSGIDADEQRGFEEPLMSEQIERALVIGIGPIGRRIASRLETGGVELCLIDLSPLNLHAFAQQGFATVAGDARDPDVLHRAGAPHRRLVVVCVPDDEEACQIVRAVRRVNAEAHVVVRCRFQSNMDPVRTAGANAVVSAEVEAAAALLEICDGFIDKT